MKNSQPLWLIGAFAILVIVIVPIALFAPRTATALDDPWANVPQRSAPVSHADIVQGEFATGPDVTRACLACHPDAAAVMHTTHFTWESKEFDVPWRDEPVTIGKANQINNFCIGTQGNEKRCMTCHVGYGWESADTFDFNDPNNVDCLACHADMGVYAKGEYGYPAEGIDLLVAARSVRIPTRDNCGTCHFDGGGGNGVKHGDLDESLYFPRENLDVHMGKHDFLCVDCHTSDENHQLKGRLLSDNYTIDPVEQVSCTDCHAETPHDDARLNQHTTAVACQTCHIPSMALKDPTKIFWDWSTAGQDIGDDHLTYLKIKGSFIYEKDHRPVYLWYNESNEYRYLLGDVMDPTQVTYINKPAGSIKDPTAKISPFKLHIAFQPYDSVYNIILQPRTAGGGNGGGGYWEVFDWQSALELGAQDTGLPFSGQYGFAETWMYWPTTHMVQPAANALTCAECHGENGRLDWIALGYAGDPIRWGGRNK
jgi:octaheme c-type cytochrome (tetrathionate reductase family)